MEHSNTMVTVKATHALQSLIQERPEMLSDVLAHFGVVDTNMRLEEPSKSEAFGKYTMAVECGGRTHLVLFNNFRSDGRNSRFIQFLPPFLLHHNTGEKCFYIVKESTTDTTEKSLFIYSLLESVGIKKLSRKEGFALYDIRKINTFVYHKSRFVSASNHSTTIQYTANDVLVHAKSGGAETGEALLTCMFCSKFGQGKPVTCVEYNDGKQNTFTKEQKAYIQSLPRLTLRPGVQNLESLAARYKAVEFENFRDQPLFIRNLQAKYGPKKTCFCCGVSNKSNIAAHIERQTDINTNGKYTDAQKRLRSTSQHNGLFLCRNHDIALENKMFSFDDNGALVVKAHMTADDQGYMRQLIETGTFVNRRIEPQHLCEEMKGHLRKHRGGHVFVAYDTFCGDIGLQDAAMDSNV